MKERERVERLSSGVVFLRNEFEGIVLKSTPGVTGKFFVKFPGERGEAVPHSHRMVTETVLEWNEITDKEYSEF